jgi:multidrug resistance protein, MATE family
VYDCGITNDALERSFRIAAWRNRLTRLPSHRQFWQLKTIRGPGRHSLLSGLSSAQLIFAYLRFLCFSSFFMTDRLPQSSSAAPAIRPIKEVWTIAWPTVLTMTSYTVMQFVDQLMVGQVGPAELAAQSNGVMWSFAVLSFALGIVTVVNTYVSQNLGAGRPENGPKYAWAAVWLAAIVWTFLLVPYALFLPWIFGTAMPALMPQLMQGHTPQLLAMETHYAQILVFGSIFVLIGRGINQFFFGLHRPRYVTVGAITGNVANLISGWILIFGDKGIPAWGIPGIPGTPAFGVYGAAFANLIGSFVEMSIPFAIFLGRKLNAELKTRSAWRPRLDTIMQLLKLGWPAGLQWGNELLCWTIFMSVLVGSFGSEHMTACAIAFGYMRLSFMPAIGFSVATNSLVGKYIGAGQPDIAVARAYLTLKMAMAYMTACALAFIIFREQAIRLFLSDDLAAASADRIVSIGSKLMICMAVFQTFDAFGIIFSGALRGAGDTVWPGMMTIIYSWVFIVLGGWLLVEYAPGLESTGPWIASSFYIIMFGLTLWWRFATGRWRSIRLVERRPELEELGAEITESPAALSDTAMRDLAESIANTMQSTPPAKVGNDSIQGDGTDFHRVKGDGLVSRVTDQP